MSEMATLLGFKSSAAIALIESGKRLTSFEGLDNICQTFCVSLDWIMGMSNKIINSGLVVSREIELLEIIRKLDPNKVVSTLYQEYLDVNFNKAEYPIMIRANIIFLLKTEVIPFLMKRLTDLSEIKISPMKLMLLRKLIKKEIKEPVFDIAKFI